MKCVMCFSASALAALPIGFGQCIEWLPSSGPSHLQGCNALVVADLDGLEGAPASLYATSTSMAGLHRWDHHAWSVAVPLLRSNVLFSLPAGSAGFPANVVVLGGSRESSTDVRRIVSTWDGQSWSAIGPGSISSFSGVCSIYSLTEWDSDGNGPASPMLIAGGQFTLFGGASAVNVAGWDGTQWRALGAGLPQTVVSLSSFDPDGPGPLPPLLAAAHAVSISVWNGSAWSTLGAAFNSTVSAVVAHDFDGGGPQGEQLFALGAFNSPGNYVARWNGAVWESAQFPASRPGALKSLDLDGPEPQPATLVAAGGFSGGRLYLYTEGGWTLIPDPNGPGGIAGLEVFDPDGPGSRQTELVAFGSSFSTPFPLLCPGVASWNNVHWRRIGDELAGSGDDTQIAVACMHEHDMDGPGPEPTTLYIGGNFTMAGGQPADGVARWDGERWIGMGQPSPNGRLVYSLASHDVDGPGPELPQLVAGDSLSTVRRWADTVWQPVGFGTGGRVLSLVSYDPDGGGPSLPQLYCGNDSGVRRWSGGTSWLAVPGVSGGTRICEHDADDQGPNSPLLMAFDYGFQNRVLRLSGSAFVPVSGISTYNNSGIVPMASLDLDGEGPLPPEILIGANYLGAGPSPLRSLAAFDGGRWRQIGDMASDGSILGLGGIDPDGPGPCVPQVVLGPGLEYGIGAYRLSDARWISIPTSYLDGASHGARAAHSFDPDGEGPHPIDHWIGGRFTSIANQPAVAVARFRFVTPPPAFRQLPSPQSAFVGGDVRFAVEAAPTQSVTHRWYRNGQALSDGPTPDGSIFAGTATAELSISSVSSSDGGEYSCTITGTCETATTTPVRLRVCVLDLNCDGHVDDFDVRTIENAINGDYSLLCVPSADLNEDGVENGFDIEFHERRMQGEAC